MIGLTLMEWKNTMWSKDKKAAPIIWPRVGSVCLGKIHFTLGEDDLPFLNTFQIKESYNIDIWNDRPYSYGVEKHYVVQR